MSNQSGNVYPFVAVILGFGGVFAIFCTDDEVAKKYSNGISVISNALTERMAMYFTVFIFVILGVEEVESL